MKKKFLLSKNTSSECNKIIQNILVEITQQNLKTLVILKNCFQHGTIHTIYY